MKIVLDVQLEGELKENDIIVFKDGKWRSVSKKSFFAKEAMVRRDADNSLKQRIETLEHDMAMLAEIIKGKQQ